MDGSPPEAVSVRADHAESWETELTPSSASKHSIDTGAGVIDADYRGPVMVLLFNYSDVDFTGKLTSTVDLIQHADISAVNKGDRVAQFILERIAMAPLLEVDVSNNSLQSR